MSDCGAIYGRVAPQFNVCHIQKVMQEWSGGRMQVEVIVFSNAHGELGRTENAIRYIKVLREQISETER